VASVYNGAALKRTMMRIQTITSLTIHQASFARIYSSSYNSIGSGPL
jgi:hypothetical protein